MYCGPCQWYWPRFQYLIHLLCWWGRESLCYYLNVYLNLKSLILLLKWQMLTCVDLLLCWLFLLTTLCPRAAWGTLKDHCFLRWWAASSGCDALLSEGGVLVFDSHPCLFQNVPCANQNKEKEPSSLGLSLALDLYDQVSRLLLEPTGNDLDEVRP